MDKRHYRNTTTALACVVSIIAMIQKQWTKTRNKNTIMYERAGGSVSSNRRKRFDANGYQNVSIDRDHAFIYKLVC